MVIFDLHEAELSVLFGVSYMFPRIFTLYNSYKTIPVSLELRTAIIISQTFKMEKHS